MEEGVSTMKVMTNSAATVTFLWVVKDVTNLLRAMKISVIMVVHIMVVHSSTTTAMKMLHVRTRREVLFALVMTVIKVTAPHVET